jgi:hypothetical protein
MILFRVDEAVNSFEITTFGRGRRVSLVEPPLALHAETKMVVRVNKR